MVNTATSHGCVMPMDMQAGEGGVACRLVRDCVSEEEVLYDLEPSKSADQNLQESHLGCLSKVDKMVFGELNCLRLRTRAW